MPSAIAITGEPGHEAEAETLGAEHDIPYLEGDTTGYDALLVACGDRLELRWLDESAGFKPLAIDLAAIDATSPQGRSLKQPIARAMGLRKGEPYRPVVFDATAGYGQDTWLLASLGCRVTAVERSPVLALLLQDALRRAAATEPEIASRITLRIGDSTRLLEAPEIHPEIRGIDVVYLDPMFPPKRKATKPSKQMWLLSQLIGPDTDSAILFAAAMKAANRRVVAKRPLHAEPLAPDPVAVHRGKSHRFDVYVPKAASS